MSGITDNKEELVRRIEVIEDDKTEREKVHALKGTPLVESKS